MRKLAIRAAFGLSALLPIAAMSAPIVLTFEGAGNVAAVNDFYNGGTDSQGHHGTNYGVNFSTTSLSLIDSDAGGSGNFANEPSPSTILFFNTGGAATMNIAAGFTTGFSFFYTAQGAGSVSVYSGLNGTGSLLATLVLPSNYKNGGCIGDPTGDFCHFDAIGVTFAGTAMSVDFGGAAGFIGFDDITLGSAVAGGGPTGVPEPESVLLLGAGLTALVVARRRRR